MYIYVLHVNKDSNDNNQSRQRLVLSPRLRPSQHPTPRAQISATRNTGS